MRVVVAAAVAAVAARTHAPLSLLPLRLRPTHDNTHTTHEAALSLSLFRPLSTALTHARARALETPTLPYYPLSNNTTGDPLSVRPFFFFPPPTLAGAPSRARAQTHRRRKKKNPSLSIKSAGTQSTIHNTQTDRDVLTSALKHERVAHPPRSRPPCCTPSFCSAPALQRGPRAAAAKERRFKRKQSGKAQNDRNRPAPRKRPHSSRFPSCRCRRENKTETKTDLRSAPRKRGRVRARAPERPPSSSSFSSVCPPHHKSFRSLQQWDPPVFPRPPVLVFPFSSRFFSKALPAAPRPPASARCRARP